MAEIQPSRCIVVVDDDTSVLRALRRIIAGAGFEVRTYERAHAFLETSIPGNFACLLIDIRMPEMNGMELCASLAAAQCPAPIILITGGSDISAPELLSKTGAVAILNKPFKKAELLATLDAALGKTGCS